MPRGVGLGGHRVFPVTGLSTQQIDLMSLVDDNGVDASEATELDEVAVQGWLIGWESGRMVSVPWTLSPSRFKRV